jgi:signal transduction histidine kinase/CheY-like chemotaxis protein
MGTGPTGDVRARLSALAEPSRLLVEIFTNVPNPLQIYARSGHTVLVNNAFIEMMGGAPPEEYNVFEDEILVERGVAGLIRRGFAGERISVPIHWYDIRETRNLPANTDTSSGRRVAISAEMIPLHDDKGEVSHVLVAFHDHTAAIEAREDAARASRNAERARFAAEIRTTHQTFLATAAGLLSSSLDLEVTLRLVAQLATESFADFCIVDLVNSDGSFRRVATLHRDERKQPLLNELQDKFPPHPGSPQPAARVIASRESELLPNIDEESLDAHSVSPEHRELLSRLGLRSHIAFPLRVGDRVLGAISLGYTETGRYTEDDLPLVQALASHAAVAIENARLFNAAEQARHEAELANRAKDEFLAMLGHELRNPLAPIVTALEISRERQGASSERKIIERQVEHLRRLVDDLLDISRITRGSLELTSTPLELADAVHDGIELARPLVGQRHHELTLDMAPSLPVHGDRLRLAQVVANLVINAARYTEPGGRISITGTRAGNDVVLRVRDTGVGMSPDLLPHVFETFMRGSRPIDRTTGGLGLGLAIVRAITEQHGGRVAARSEGPGRGSELEITLPALDANVPRRTTPTELPPPRSDVRGRGVVLVVDDNDDAAQLIGDALRIHGFNVVVATHPHAALVLADKHSPVIALIDLGLPDMDGYELANRLRSADGKMHCIAITGFGHASDRERTTAAGFVSHLVKPIKMPALIPLLEQLLSQLPDR